MQNITPTWRDYAHMLTPEQCHFVDAWSDPDRFDRWSLQSLGGTPDEIADMHRGRLVTLARDWYGALGPGRLN
jgi:hypothetical protein